MTRHQWVARADGGVRFGIQIGAVRRRTGPMMMELYDEPARVIIEAGILVEELGFDGLFVFDHPSIMPDPWACLSALAIETEKVVLGSVVNCIYYRHPAHLARLASDLDHISGGRAMLGLGIGWAIEEFQSFGILFRSTAERQRGMDEALTIINGVWGDEPFSFEGDQFTVNALQITPPLQPVIPILIGGGGEQVTLRKVALRADACNFSTRDGPSTAQAKLAALRRHCEACGRQFDDILKSDFVGWPIIGTTDENAREKLAQVFPGGVPKWADHLLLVGTPDSIASYFIERVAAGMQYFVIQVLDGRDHETLKLIAEEVVPRVRESVTP
jgi:alkanesulfonate monooxygenase SsuD/methylene tetrahydromethanopterin reductase-like flavin-dependent oxidoreductase (luciferase family)